MLEFDWAEHTASKGVLPSSCHDNMKVSFKGNRFIMEAKVKPGDHMKRLPYILPLAVVAVSGLLAIPSHQVAATAIPSNERPRIEAVRCTVAKGRITNITEALRTVSERRTTAYTNIRERTVARVTVLKQKGYDTSKLEADLTKLDNQIKDYRTKAGNLTSLLISAQEQACSDSEGDFAATLTETRTQLKVVREASQAIHQTFRSSIVPGLQTAATWVKNN
jgi:hypothetical protein